MLGPSCTFAGKRLEGPVVLGMLANSPCQPTGLQTSGRRTRAAGPSVRLAKPAAPSLPQGQLRKPGWPGPQRSHGGHRRRMEVRGQGLARGRGYPFYFVDFTFVDFTSVRGTEHLSGGLFFGGSQPAICCGFSQTAAQANVSLGFLFVCFLRPHHAESHVGS